MTGRRRLVRSTGILADQKTDREAGITDEMVERAAKALHDLRHPTFEWEHAAEFMTKHHWRQQARAALVAALGTDR